MIVVALLDLMIAAWVGLLDLEAKRGLTLAVQFLIVLAVAIAINVLLGGFAWYFLGIYVVVPSFIVASVLSFLRPRIGKIAYLSIVVLASLAFVGSVTFELLNFPKET